MEKNRGFTLIELMIVVAIVGILAAVAYPSYMEHVRKGNRATAQAFMMEVLQKQQSYLLQNRVYAQTLAALGLSTPEDVSSYYTVATNLGVASDTDPSKGFALTLTPPDASMQKDDGLLCVTHTGARARKACPGTSGAEAW